MLHIDCVEKKREGHILCTKNIPKLGQRTHRRGVTFRAAITGVIFGIGGMALATHVEAAEELFTQKKVDEQRFCDVLSPEQSTGVLPIMEHAISCKSIDDGEEGVTVQRRTQLTNLLAETPMVVMVGDLLRQQEEVAAFMVAIAKKESNWGMRAPSKEGEDCYNYWGFKGAGERGAVLGYACFAAPSEAVARVGERIQELRDNGITTPERFVVWKCGRTCQGHDPVSVQKWISDVSLIYYTVRDIHKKPPFTK